MKIKPHLLFLRDLPGPKHWKSKLFLLILLLCNIKQPVLPQLVPDQNLYNLACSYSEDVYKIKTENTPVKIRAKAVIVSHHLLARDLIGKTLGKIDPDYDTIILLGPNHFEQGKENIQTSASLWKTKFENLEPDLNLISEITFGGHVHIDEQFFYKEHSICGLVSFLKINFPQSKIVPLIFKSVTTIKEAENLGNLLSKNCRNCLVIASVDFSHNVSQEQALVNDQKSMEILKTRDQKRIKEITSDSLPTLATLMTFLNQKGAKAEFIQRSDSYIISQDNINSVTSYLFLLYR